MNVAALSRGWRKAARTLLQLAVGGSLTAVVDLLAHGLSPATAGAVMTIWTALVAFLHNYLETAGKIPTIFATPGLVTSTIAPVAQATVTAQTSTTGAITGAVTDTAGEVIGKVTGQVPEPPL